MYGRISRTRIAVAVGFLIAARAKRFVNRKTCRARRNRPRPRTGISKGCAHGPWSIDHVDRGNDGCKGSCSKLRRRGEFQVILA
jgi:hypothetical protein